MDLKFAKLCCDTIRCLSADAIDKANSGHPGIVLGAVDYTFVLWTKFMRHAPKQSQWINRDRFILSAGHGSMLLYSFLHLFGYGLTLEDIKNFRQWGSLTPGHPEFEKTNGVETTTGPLGQGFANGVGMALGSKLLQNRLNRQNEKIIDNKIFVVAGDGCMMEGITAEAASFAGHLGLDNLVVIYDDNHITIEGRTDLCFTENTSKKFEAMGWETFEMNGHDYEEINDTFEKALKVKGKPVFIKAKTIIGLGAPNKQDDPDVHGSPLGSAEVIELKKNLGFPTDKTFYIPEEVSEYFRNLTQKLNSDYDEWKKKFTELYNKNENFKKDFDKLYNTQIPFHLKEKLYQIFPYNEKIETRTAGGKIMNAISEELETLVGGSADLAPSTKTFLKKSGYITRNDFSGHNISFGIREHSMAAIINGLALNKPFIPFGSTFFVFSDYMRPGIRMAALMNLQVIYVMTHDSFYVGEDGPTHQPIEHLMAQRVIPNLIVLRPADAIETVDAWFTALANSKRPSLIALTRQKVNTIDRNKYSKPEVSKGAYIIKKASNPEKLDCILIATGSEVDIAIQAAELLEKEENYSIRVVSMPSMELFLEQSEDYQKQILPDACKKRLAVEAGIAMGWEKFVGTPKNVLGINHFGSSAPGEVLADKFGLTVEHIRNKIKKYILR